MPAESGRVTTVVQQDGDRVLLSVPMVGFPPNFQLKPGERVVLVDDDQGPAVRPLVIAHTVRAAPSTVAARGAVESEGRSYSLQASTVVEDEAAAAAAPAQPTQYVVWVVDPGENQGPPQAIAVRRER